MSHCSKQLERIRDSHNWSQRVTMSHKHVQSLGNVSQQVTTDICTLGCKWKTQVVQLFNPMVSIICSLACGLICTDQTTFCAAFAANRGESIARERKSYRRRTSRATNSDVARAASFRNALALPRNHFFASASNRSPPASTF